MSTDAAITTFNDETTANLTAALKGSEGTFASSSTSWFYNTTLGQNRSDSDDLMSLGTLTALTRLYGCIGIACFVLGLLLNGLVFSYFYSRRKSLSNTLYCVIVIVDLLVSALMLPYVLPHFSELKAPVLFSSQGFCKFWTVMWGAASKTTVVLILVAVLGILRTVNLLAPLRSRIKSRGDPTLFCIILRQI